MHDHTTYRAHRCSGHVPAKTKKVDGPHVVVFEAPPKHGERDGLTIVHAALAGIVTKDAVDHDLFFALVEPTILAAEFRRSLGRRRWNVEIGYDANDSGNHTFEGKEPLPTSHVAVASQVENTVSQKGGYNRSTLVADPEV